MRSARRWFAVLILTAGCQAGTESNLVDVAGEWTFTELLQDRAHGMSCADTGTYRITQTGDRFSGIYAQRGVCLTPAGAVDNADSGFVSNGRVVGHTIQFTVTANCQYEGSASGMPAAALRGGAPACCRMPTACSASLERGTRRGGSGGHRIRTCKGLRPPVFKTGALAIRPALPSLR